MPYSLSYSWYFEELISSGTTLMRSVLLSLNHPDRFYSISFILCVFLSGNRNCGRAESSRKKRQCEWWREMPRKWENRVDRQTDGRDHRKNGTATSGLAVVLWSQHAASYCPRVPPLPAPPLAISRRFNSSNSRPKRRRSRPAARQSVANFSSSTSLSSWPTILVTARIVPIAFKDMVPIAFLRIKSKYYEG